MAVYYQCPSCRTIIPDDPEKVMLVCGYCGTTITKTEEAGSIAAIKKEKYKHDIARRKIDAKERAKEREDRNDRWLFISLASIIVFGLLLVTIVSYNSPPQENQTAKLEALVLEIEQDVANGDYDTALLKANRVRWDGVGKTDAKKWDEERKELIKLIKELQKKNK